MIETIDIELNGFEYQVEIDVDTVETWEDGDFQEDVYHTVEVIDVYLVRGRKVYRVANEFILEEINNLDLMEFYFDQCV